ncbi:MAG: D-glycero-beta-D-manno-heptose 1,7-bisphosphate 7-phosphatase [Desulfobacterales bacterium]|jgi:D-glycero-D-manno-heptose 1,7-bisphosphate phosphatase|nr:D-glycero-beta-D-manno-heptose 1,7-bisphosphate 7-phosphatase [Desulfobacterales bacterium]
MAGSIQPPPVVFLDRDGVINRDSPGYIKSLAEFEFLPGSLEALRRLAEHGFEAIIVTNQSALGRGWLRAEALAAIHRRLCDDVLHHGGRIRDILVCPHRPDENCACRKPRPGLIMEARRRHGIDVAAAVMIGDSGKDIECALNAGVGASVLVRTGNGRQAEAELRRKGIVPDGIAADLPAAVDWILHRRRS